MAFSRLFIIAVAAGCLCVNSFRLKRNQGRRFGTRSSDNGKAESEEEVPGPGDVSNIDKREILEITDSKPTKPSVFSYPAMRLEDFPERDAFKLWRQSNGSAQLYSFTNGDIHYDPCKTDCSVCPASSSAGFDPASLADGGWPCLCHSGYRAAVKAGDYKTRFTHTDLPYEFLLAGAFGQSHLVKAAVYLYLLKCIHLIADAQHSRYEWGSQESHTAESPEVHLMGSNAERAASLAEVMRISRIVKVSDPIKVQLGKMFDLELSIDFVFSCLYKLLPKVYDVFNRIAKKVPTRAEVEARIDQRLFNMKKEYVNFFCVEATGKRGPCDFQLDVQMEKALHEEHDFSQPFDGWFEWRFISKKDGSGPPQKGPFTPGFKEALPIVDRAQTTLNVYKAIGLPFTEKNGELQKMRSLLAAKYGDAWDENSVLPMGSGITWWEQFDCDCSLETCNPSAENQICEGGFNRVAGRLGGRSVAGPSGTTQKMMQVARLLKLGPEALYLLRAGLIAWMVPAEDHSLLEILMGAEGSGLPYQHDSRAYSLSALLPGDELQPAREEVEFHLKTLHDRFGLEFSVQDGPRSLCVLGKKKRKETGSP